MNVINVCQNSSNQLPAFEGSNLHIRLCNRILNRKSEITPSAYNEMSFLSKYILRKNSPERLQELAKTTCDIAYKLKQKFDECFGENNYMIIALGRSIASVAEALNFMGGESVVIPLSGLRHVLPSKIPDVGVYRKYLERIGLTKKIIKDNPDKQYILMDYAVSGDSLSTAKEFLEKPELLGKADNFTDREINPYVRSLRILNLFYHERFKNFSPVGRLPIYRLKEISMQSNSETSREGRGNICQYMRKLFLFNLLDCIAKDNFHDFVPEKEINAVARYEASDYMERTMLKALQGIKERLANLTNKF